VCDIPVAAVWLPWVLYSAVVRVHIAKTIAIPVLEIRKSFRLPMRSTNSAALTAIKKFQH